MQALKQMHLNSLNLTQEYAIKQGDEWREVCSAQGMLEYVKWPKDLPKSQPKHIYKPSQS